MQYIKTKMNAYRSEFHRPNIYSERLLHILRNGILCLVLGLILFGLKLGAISLGMVRMTGLIEIMLILMLSYFLIFQTFRAISTVVISLILRILPKKSIEKFSFGVMVLISIFPLAFLIDMGDIFIFSKDIKSNEYDVVHKQNTVYLFGRISEDMFRAFSDRVSSDQPINTVWIDSDGGSIRAASKISEIIALNGYDTRVDATCSSACWDVFSAGLRREVDIYAYFGCHRAQLPGIRRIQSTSGVSEIMLSEHIVASSIRNTEIKINRSGRSIVDVDNENIPLSGLELEGLQRSKIESEALKLQKALSDSCSATPNERVYRASIEELLTVGLATHVRMVGGNKYLSPKQDDWYDIRITRDFKQEQLLVHSQIIRTALKQLAGYFTDHWTVTDEDSWFSERYVDLAPLFEKMPPEPLCLSEQEYDAIEEKSAEHHHYLTNCGMKSTLDESDLEPFSDLMSRIEIISGCPLPSEYRKPIDLGGLCPQ